MAPLGVVDATLPVVVMLPVPVLEVLVPAVVLLVFLPGVRPITATTAMTSIMMRHGHNSRLTSWPNLIEIGC